MERGKQSTSVTLQYSDQILICRTVKAPKAQTPKFWLRPDFCHTIYATECQTRSIQKYSEDRPCSYAH